MYTEVCLFMAGLGMVGHEGLVARTVRVPVDCQVWLWARTSGRNQKGLVRYGVRRLKGIGTNRVTKLQANNFEPKGHVNVKEAEIKGMQIFYMVLSAKWRGSSGPMSVTPCT